VYVVEERMQLAGRTTKRARSLVIAVAIVTRPGHPDRRIVMFMTTDRGFASNYPPLNVRLGPALRRRRRVSNQLSSSSRTVGMDPPVEVCGSGPPTCGMSAVSELSRVDGFIYRST